MYSLIRRALFQMDAEQAHHLTTVVARAAQRTAPALIRKAFAYRSPLLEQSVFGVPFANPIGLAAGADKNGEMIRFFTELGFGFVEVGSVSARPAPGNPKPRAFRLPADRALVNRMGLNNDGARVVGQRLAETQRNFECSIGVNLAKTHDPSLCGQLAIDDFVESFRTLAPVASYIALNISCPNTREGKTFEEKEALTELLDAIRAERASVPNVPVLVKLSPPAANSEVSAEVASLVRIALDRGVNGFIASNTASDREGLRSSNDAVEAIGRGGLSGRPLAARSTQLVRYLYKEVSGQVPIIGVGGIENAADAYEKIGAGASLVELYTSLVYEGPTLPGRIARGLAQYVERDGFSNIADAVGSRNAL